MSELRNVETLVVLQPIAVDTGSPDSEGRLVIARGMLMAVLVQMNDTEHKNHGRWFLEAGFGQLNSLRPLPFDSLEDATRWFRKFVKP